MKKQSIRNFLKQMKTNTAAILSLCAVFVIISCSKPEHASEGLFEDQLSDQELAAVLSGFGDLNVTVKDGALHFTDTATFFADAQKIMEMSGEEFSEFEENIGFTSLSSELASAYRDFDEIETEAELGTWQGNYGDIVELRDSVVTPLISQGIYQRIANRSGEYYLAGTYNKVDARSLVTVLDGNKDKLANGLTQAKSDATAGIIVSALNEPQGNEAGTSDMAILTCAGGTHQAAQRQVDKRKVFLNFDIVPFRGIYTVITTVQVKAYGHKKNLFGWNKYDTKFALENIQVSIFNAHGIFEATPNNLSTTSTSNQYDLIFSIAYNDETGINEYVTPAGYEAAKARATSRGTQPYWAVFCCSGLPCPSDFGYFTF